jgi:hypothetical protein
MPAKIKRPQNQYVQMLLWLTPSLLELAIYFFIALFTFLISSQDIIKQNFFISGDFNPIQSAINSIDLLLRQFVGEKVAGSLSLAIFWGLVGLGVNAIWWVGSNFSSELTNDLVFSKYVHPKDADPKSPLREFIEKTAFRTVAVLITIFYTNLYLSDLLPRITARMSYFIEDWSNHKHWGSLLLAIFSQMFLLHIFTILIRLVLLKKQIF